MSKFNGVMNYVRELSVKRDKKVYKKKDDVWIERCRRPVRDEMFVG